MSWPFSLMCLLAVTSLIAMLRARLNSSKAVEIYFRAQLLVNPLLWAFSRSRWYALVYVLAGLLIVETNIFLLLDEGVSQETVKMAVTFAALMTSIALTAMERVTHWIVLGESFVLSALGFALLSTWEHAREKVALAGIGTLTFGMALYDYLYLIQPEVERTGSWMPSVLCAAAFLWMARNLNNELPVSAQ